jgi:N-acyl homoserine lactone hydrolase
MFCFVALDMHNMKEHAMCKFQVLATALLALVATQTPLAAKDTAALTLTRLDCGSVQVNDLNAFSDTLAYAGQHRTLTSSCYLIRHGDTLMIWDTGLPAALKGAKLSNDGDMSATVAKTLDEQLAALGIKPADIDYVGISHFHFDHIGQVGLFTNAILLIGADDWSVLTTKPVDPRVNPAPFEHWITGGGKVDSVSGDKDVFGDGSIILINTPGHTPGHHSLLVNLKKKGPVLLTGDLAHFTENYNSNGVPGFNTNRADTLASLDRFKKMAANLKATVIIQHESTDVAKLPAFPKAAD